MSSSLSSPQVAGAGLLLMTGGVTNQRSIKALMINTTFRPSALSDTTWVAGYGWGMLDAHHAYYHATQGDYTEGTVGAAGESDDKVYVIGSMNYFDTGNNTYDRATLVWDRHVSWSYGDTNAVAEDLSDLDLFLYDGNQNVLVSSSTSTIDNVEQVFWNSTEDTLAKAILVVECESSSLPEGWSYEPFSLATEGGFTRPANPRSIVGIQVEENTGELFDVDINYEVKFRVFQPDSVALCGEFTPSISGLDANTSIVAGPSPTSFEIEPGDTTYFSYTLSSSTTGRRSITGGATSSCYRGTWWVSDVATYRIEDLGHHEGGAVGDLDENEYTAEEFEITSVQHESGRVVLNYISPANRDLEVSVFDIRGHRIYDIDSIITSTSGSFEWNLRNRRGARVASGRYFMRIQCGAKTTVEKVLVVR